MYAGCMTPTHLCSKKLPDKSTKTLHNDTGGEVDFHNWHPPHSNSKRASMYIAVSIICEEDPLPHEQKEEALQMLVDCCTYLFVRLARSSSCHQTQQPNEETRSNDGNDDASNETKVRIGNEQVRDQPAKKRSNQADHDIANKAIATSSHNPTCNETSN